MIFSISNHIEQIIKGTKTQTRRTSDRYQVGKTYSIQPKRTAKGIREGKIKITNKRLEKHPCTITHDDAKAEGNYLPGEFEFLYEKLHPNWHQRIAYTFKFVPKEGLER